MGCKYIIDDFLNFVIKTVNEKKSNVLETMEGRQDKMKKWKKFLMAMFVTVVIIATIGMFNLGTANATELHRSNGVNSRPGNAQESRAWGNVVGQNGANFRVRHYRRLDNGGSSLLSISPWGTSGATVNTPWSGAPAANTAAVLANVSTW